MVKLTPNIINALAAAANYYGTQGITDRAQTLSKWVNELRQQWQNENTVQPSED